MRYLLDTNVLSEPLKPRPNAQIMDGLQRHRQEIVTATPVWHELLYGCYRLPPSRQRRTLEHFVQRVLAPSLPVLPYTTEAAAWHAAERARLGASGQPAPFVDGQIAAIAQVHGLVLVTRNLRDFQDFQGLSVLDWAS